MLRKFLPHITIVICNMYVVFYFIDRVNSAMQFVNNSLTKALLLVMCLLSSANAAILIRDNRRRQAAQNRRREAARSAQHARPANHPAELGSGAPHRRTRFE